MSTDKAQELHDALAERVAALVSSDDWTQWLAFAAKFHTYSMGNQLLIALQRPDASQVAGYERWRKVGRHVRKGEKGIAILAPCTSRHKVEADDGTETTVSRVFGFKAAHVFDVSQTDGEDLPERILPARSVGDAPDGLWDGLAAQAVALGYSVEQQTVADVRIGGWCNHAERLIVVRDDVASAQACKTLAHELAHAILHEGITDYQTSARGRYEVEAESVAYVVCAASGAIVDGYSLPYVASWSDGNAKLVTETGQRVVTCARQILAALAPVEVELAS